MKKDYYIIKKDGVYSYTTELTDDVKDYVVFTGSCNEKFISLMANKKIGEFKLAEGIIEELPKEFIGKGEVKGFSFTQVYNDNDFYIYIVDGLYYEIFDRKIVGNEVKYPKAEDFGDWAWTFQRPENVVKFVRGHYHVTITEDQITLK